MKRPKTVCARCGKENVTVVNIKATGKMCFDVCRDCYESLHKMVAEWLRR